MESHTERSPLLSQPNHIRICILGYSGVGKSSLHLRFASNIFRRKYSITYLAAQLINIARVGEDLVKFEVWDTAGQPRFHKHIPHYSKMAEAVLIVYDISSKKSFEFAKKLLNQVRKEKQEMPILIVGNKKDLGHLRQVSTEEGGKLAKEFGVPFLEASAKNDTNIKQVFETIYLITKKEENSNIGCTRMLKLYLRKLLYG